MKTFVRYSMVFLSVVALVRAAPLAWRSQVYVAHDKEKTQIRGQVAQLSVPENPALPAGPQVQLALMRLPATTKSPGAPIVYLHGGPGGSALEHLESADFRALFAALQAKADVVLLDQRGCGKSTPSLVPGIAGRPSGEVFGSRENFLAHLESSSVMVRDRLTAAGHDPRCYTVRESVADIEALRSALGVAKIDLFAHSYGTQLAQAFVREYPGSVGRMVLVGARGMDTTRKLPAEADAFLERIAELARADATVGAKFPDLVGTLRRVLVKLDAAPVAVEMENEKKEKFTLRVGGYVFRFIVAKFYLNDPQNFRYLPKVLDELDTARKPWSLVFNLAQLLRSPVSYAWLTTDAASGVTSSRAGVIAAQARVAVLGDAMNFPFPEINRIWAVPDAGDAFRAPVITGTPTLFVAGTLDGITPVSQAREIIKGFAQGRLLVVENGGHNSQIHPPEVASAISGFFAGQSSPDRVTMPVAAFMPLIAK